MIRLTRKIVDTMALACDLSTRFIALEGPARSSKTATAIQSFFYAVYQSADKYHLIASRDLDAVKNNILEAADVGLLTTHPDCRLTRSAIGGYYVTLIGKDQRRKTILLVYYANKSTWKKILGNSIGVTFIDEVNIATEDFVNETFARQLNSASPLTICTLNGDNPMNFAYQNYINYGKVRGKVPVSTLIEMTKFQEQNGLKPGYYYEFYGLTDNPVMTPEKIERAMSIYPVGSFYYRTKILGERGVQGVLIFDEYMREDLIVNAFSLDSDGRRTYPLSHFTIGIDIGENRADNVFILTGWSADYSRAICLAFESFKHVGYDEKTKRLLSWLKRLLDTGVLDRNRLDGIYVDSAEQNYIADLKTLVKRTFNFDVTGSYKATVKDRIDMLIVGFSTRRVLFDKSCRTVYEAYRSARWAEGKLGKEREDLGLAINDFMDSFEYSLTRHMKALMNGGNAHVR